MRCPLAACDDHSPKCPINIAKAKEAEVEYSNSNRELWEKKSAMKAKVFTVVDSVTTIKRLTEIWPEITEFLPEKVSGSGGGLPAYIISDLNASVLCCNLCECVLYDAVLGIWTK